MVGKLFLIDLDDTLIPTAHHYNIARARFQLFVSERMSEYAPQPEYVQETLKQAESVNLPKYGFGRLRFPMSLKEAYQRLLEECGQEPNEADLLAITNMAEVVFDQETYRLGGFKKGAQRALQFIQSQGDHMQLVTKGDRDVQISKVNALNLHEFFAPEDIIVVDNKDAGEIERIVGERNKKLTWKIGNLLGGDIEPALTAGIGAIYVPFETWHHERSRTATVETACRAHPRFHEISSLRQFSTLYPSLR